MVQEDRRVELPLDDVSALILESPQIVLTQSVLTVCAEKGVAVMACDSRHHPVSLSLPFSGHCRQAAVAIVQRSWSDTFIAGAWRQLVIAKIRNQASALRMAVSEFPRLERMVSELESSQKSQPTALEAQAARIYFPRMFRSDFRRHNSADENPGLDYGYAILRACIAINLAAYGFYPAWGIHHHHPENAFNLADDLIEPFRPWVDYWVKIGPSIEGQINKNDKVRLVEVLQAACVMKGKSYRLRTAIERMVKSLSTATFSANPKDLILPQWPETFEIKSGGVDA